MKYSNLRLSTAYILLFFIIPLTTFANPRPNIIVLLTDDQRHDAIGYVENSLVKTPHMNALAKSGIIFNNAYVTTSVCCASRASILTGQYALRHGIHGFRTDISHSALLQTYPLQLKNNAGYTIGFVGKYGIGLEGHPEQQFDYWGCEFLLDRCPAPNQLIIRQPKQSSPGLSG